MRALFPKDTTLLYKVIWALLPPNIVLYVWLTVDYLAHPFATAMYGPEEMASPYVRALITLVLSPVVVTLGVLVMKRAPGNVVGVLVTIMGLFLPSFGVGAHSGPLLPALQSWMIPIWYTCLMYMVTLFPDGRLLWPRAERLLVAVMLYTFVWGIVNGVADLQLSTLGPPVYNTLYVAELVPLNELLTSIGLILTVPIVIVGVFLSPLLRYRSTKPGSRERQQIKWLAFCAAVMAVFLIAYIILVISGVSVDNPVTHVFRLVYGVFYAVFPPITLGLAILRHRLYDIDVIIRRTLVYSILTATLALVYWGGVAGLQALLRPLTGEGNDLAIVATTLGVAAIFLPLRRLVQRVIDRRFYRRKYDAARTLAQFGEMARDEVDLEALKGRLVQVVGETMQPEHVSLWLLSAGGPHAYAPATQEAE